MIAGAFAYFNYKFSEYKFIDFKDFAYYEKSDIFKPTAKKYIVVFYSSKDKRSVAQLTTLNLNLPILAIDYYNKVEANTKHITFLRSGTNTSLKFIQRFNLYEVPSIFFIKKTKDTLYKQDSMIRKLDNITQLHKEVTRL